MKTLSTLIAAGALALGLSAAAHAGQVVQPSTAAGGPEHYNSAQVGIIKNVLIERYKASIAMLQSGMSCMQKATSQEGVQACMTSQAEAAAVDQKTSQAAVAKMQKDLQAAAK